MGQGLGSFFVVPATPVSQLKETILEGNLEEFKQLVSQLSAQVNNYIV